MVKNKNIMINLVACVLFFGVFIASAWAFWGYLGDILFGAGSQLGVQIVLPGYYYILSCVFAAILVTLVIFAYVFKNKLLALLPLIYQILTVLSVICFAILISNPNESTYTISIVMFTMFSPLYGFCDLTFVWSLFLILPLFLASFIVTYKVFKYHKSLKEFKVKKK